MPTIEPGPAPRKSAKAPGFHAEERVVVPVDGASLEGLLAVPHEPAGIVVFTHGNSGRDAASSRALAQALLDRGLATLLLDLLTVAEERDVRANEVRFDVPLLAERLLGALAWVRRQPGLRELSTGLFGSGPSSPAALVAAAEQPAWVGAVVLRGGRADLAGESLGRVIAPTMIVVGGEDELGIELNQRARRLLKAENELHILPGASHRFDEPGAIERVAGLAAEWFERHLTI